MGLFKTLLSSNEREIKKFRRVAEQINALEPQMKSLSDAELRGKTDEFRERLAEGETLDDLLVEAFAVVREAGCRTFGPDKARHFDAQMIGGIVLHQGRIAEMKTGEGKTLTATLPLYLNALEGRGAHLVTVNDYLAKRDARWYGPIYHFLGLTVAAIQGQSAETGDSRASYIYDPTYVPEDQDEWEHLRPLGDPKNQYDPANKSGRRLAYQADITYGTNSEFGFDYLYDNMAFGKDELVQRELHYAIVDEVDSILIDEARTPLIISGQAHESTDMYYKMDRVVARLAKERDFTVDEKAKTAMLTEDGTTRIEEAFGCGNLADPENLELMQHANAALKARAVFKRDVDYVVRDGQVVIVDEFTGRLMFGRRWSDGLHQAVEAKEGAQIQQENQTLATITYQNYFRLYHKLAGMTGTAKTEEEEFRKIYALDVVEIPTNRPMIRRDNADVIYKSEEAKFRGITEEILRCYARQQPVLVGTRSIQVSERVSERMISERLQLLGATIVLRRKLEESKQIDGDKKREYHALLNAKFDELTMPRLSGLARALGASTNMLLPENVDTLGEMLGVAHEDRTALASALENGIVHNGLNAKYHEMEAQIIAEAGRKGGVTIATNMAGRGVDIILGGSHSMGRDLKSLPNTAESLPNNSVRNGFDPSKASWDFKSWVETYQDRWEMLSDEAKEVIYRGGLHILGTERHESRRIDNQLRGRSGRQGDPGSARFFVSLEDELWRLFGDKTQNPLLRGWQEDQALDSGLLSKMIERAQKKVEVYYFGIRKHVLEYDDVMNVQRETIYGQRRKILEGVNLRPTITDYLHRTVQEQIDTYCVEGMHPSEWDTDSLFHTLNDIFPLEVYARPSDLKGKQREELTEFLDAVVERTYQDKEQEIGVDTMRDIERHIALQLINSKWMDHLEAMDYLREGIALRSYAQQDPLVAYKKEAYEIFMGMQHSIQEDIVRWMYRVQIAKPQPVRRQQYYNVVESGAGDGGGGGNGGPTARGGDSQARKAAPKKASGKIGRNDPCPCGSGKKYKKCCLGKYEE
ncbi:MAG: preprotein translocase subunit SecA [Armatimonadetes bacterium]|nr:preprotein translocase subunit SecA [Armatimonadota bacterium]